MYYMSTPTEENNVDTTKAITILARVTEDQKKRLLKECERLGITTSDWVRLKIDQIRGKK